MYDDTIRIRAESAQSPASAYNDFNCKQMVFCNSMSTTILFNWWVVTVSI